MLNTIAVFLVYGHNKNRNIYYFIISILDYKSKRQTPERDIMRKWSKMEALADILLNFNNTRISTLELAKRWNWKHHSAVFRLLNEMVELGLMEKESSSQGTKVTCTLEKRSLIFM